MIEPGDSSRELSVVRNLPKRRYSKVVEKYPLLKGTTRSYLDTGGDILVSDRPLDSELGVMSAAEKLTHADTADDLKDQTKVALFQGAAVALTNAVLGYPGGSPVAGIDESLWNKRLETEEAYLHQLLGDRKEIQNKVYGENEEGATVNLVYIIELAQSLSPEDQREYLEKVAERRAMDNLGVGENRETYRDAIQRRVAKELDYLQNAIKTNSESHGRKNLTYLGKEKPEKQKMG